MSHNQPEKLTGETLNISEQRKQELKQLFPGVFTETVNAKGELVETIDFEKLKAELGTFSDVYEGRRERYGMEWPGKRDCMKLIQEPSRATLKPCREESVDFDTTQSLFIEGDNLEVLKLLQKSYYGKVKMIYIDPPYNTGKEFIYPDNYKDSLETYLAYAGLVDDEGKKFSTNTAAEGRFHTKWLNMMYPRLYLARNLLREDGFIVVSIDDAEYKNAFSMLNEIFGEENEVATLVWDRNRKNDAKLFSVGHEYMLVFAKNKALLTEDKVVLREEKEGIKEVKDYYDSLVSKFGKQYDIIQNEWRNYFRGIDKKSPLKQLGRFSKIGPLGPYRDDGDISWPGGGGPRYEVLHPKTNRPCKVPKGGWVYSTPETFWSEVKIGRVVFGDDETTLPRQCRFLLGGDGQVMPSVFFSYAQTATLEFVELMDARVFENPKNWRDISRIVKYLSNPDSIVLDFFSGSGTTGHAVFAANNDDDGTRRFITVQLPEPCEEKSVAKNSGFNTIADIGKERIRRAAQKIRQEREGHTNLEGKGDLDLGFKVLKLDRSNFKQWQTPSAELSADQLTQQLELHADHIDPYATQEEILYELLLKAGFMPTEKIETLDLAGKQVFSIAGGTLLICLEDELSAELIDAVAEREPMQFICLDKGFKCNDQLKANAVQTFKSRSQNAETEMVFKVV